MRNPMRRQLAEVRRLADVRPLDRLSSIRVKLGSITVLAVLVTIGTLYVLIGFALRNSEREVALRQSLGSARDLSTQAFDAGGRRTASLPEAAARAGHFVLVVDAQGEVLQASMPVPGTVAKALAGSVDTGVVDGLEYVGVPVVRSGAVTGAVYIGTPTGNGLSALSATADLLRGYWWQLLLAGAVAASVALVIARFLARGMTTPLREMAAAARRMSQGDYRNRVAASTRDEVGQLASAFNRMAAQLEGVEASRRELVGNVSHELKTPISALQAHLENLLDGVEEPNPEVLAVMLAQCERLARLVDQLLDLSRLESGDVPLELQPVSLGELVDQVVAEVGVSRPDRAVQVVNDVGPGIPPLRADRERLHQVLYNLLDNAFRFTPAGGTVTVGAHRENGFCSISVHDTGVGIPEEHITRVFERFYRVDSSRARSDGGTGIGLAIARSVVEAHGGTIWAEPGGRAGATFRFLVPLWDPAPGWDAGSSSPAILLHANGGTPK
ncbi:MAG TPA: ATP-binding protein [Actinomycetota bacterium]